MVTSRYIAAIDPRDAPVSRFGAVVLGAGIAGLSAALALARWCEVAVLCKGKVEESSTFVAQGGIAAAVGPDDSPGLHERDTLAAGAGLSERAAVRTLAEEAPMAIRELIERGTPFDRVGVDYALTREGAHHRNRILHVGGDATGRGIASALIGEARRHPNIALYEDSVVTDVLTVGGRCVGVLALQEPGGWRAFIAGATVLATGGAGQLYARTTNPEGATADGIALAFRAGAEVRDLEFVQFHPTAFAVEKAPAFLVSEALRGEGAILRNAEGHRFMETHPLRELAPRDVVARAIAGELAKGPGSEVFLDITHKPREWLRARFPNIYRFCQAHGFDLSRDWIPVAPAAHYMMGGVVTDLYGETSVQGLFAVGETASTGVHGANRLASNSLIEGVVFGRRAAERACVLVKGGPAPWPPGSGSGEGCDPALRTVRGEAAGPDVIASFRRRLQRLMMSEVGVFRSGESLGRALEMLGGWLPFLVRPVRTRAEAEWVNLLTVAYLVAEAAFLREESRGAHYRADYPDTDDTHWRAHLVFSRCRGAHIREVDQDGFG
ncbi:MAG: L-aspartate oxidase [Kyrpidia sp.]|nr:L-aspartate oxidase [Kyrpidia sp.]